MVRNTMRAPPGGVWDPNSKIRHTFGWVTRRASWISRLKRSSAVGWRAAVTARTVLSATRSASWRSSTS